MGVVGDVVFALRRNASTDPPGHPGGVLTDQGLAWYGHTPDSEGPWYSELCAYGSPPLDPQPSWWLDVRPSDEPLTTEALERIHAVAIRSQIVRMPDANALRAALDALTKQSPPDQSGG